MVLEISIPTGRVRVCVQARGCVSPVTTAHVFLAVGGGQKVQEAAVP